MTEFEELERRKKELELKHDIANLELNERIRGAATKATSWSWFSGIDFGASIRSIVKIASSIFLAVIALSIVAAIAWKSYDLWTIHDAEQYEVLREWPLDLQEHLQLNVLARTKMVDGKLLMDVKLDGSPPYLTEPQLREFNADRTIDFIFQDKDGFPIFRKVIKLGWFSRIVDSGGATVGGSYAFTETFTLADYTKFARLSAEWTIQMAMPKVLPQVPQEKKDGTDHCAPNLSREERLKRLSQYGEVRQIGDKTYTVGLRNLAFHYDGTLMLCH